MTNTNQQTKTDPRELIARVRMLENNATPGPWEAVYHAQNGHVCYFRNHPDYDKEYPIKIHGSNSRDERAELVESRRAMEGNIAWIEESRTLLPNLADALDAALDENAVLKTKCRVLARALELAVEAHACTLRPDECYLNVDGFTMQAQADIDEEAETQRVLAHKAEAAREKHNWPDHVDLDMEARSDRLREVLPSVQAEIERAKEH